MPRLIDHLVFRARVEPGSVALQALQRQLTFGQLLRFVRRLGARFRQIGIQPGQVVVTSIPDKYLDWIMTLALSHEGAVSCSNQGHASLEGVLAYDWMITDRAVGHFPARKTIVIDRNWLAALEDPPQPIAPVAPGSDASPCRIVFTSGTTGRRKAVALSSVQAIERARKSIQCVTPYDRFLSLFAMSTGLGLNAAIISLLKGAPHYCFGADGGAAEMIHRFSIEGIHGSPVQIAGLMKRAAESNLDLASVKVVISAGGAPSPLYLETVAKSLTANVYNDYGSTETANIGAFKPTPRTPTAICGFLWPDAQVEVVDETHAPLPRGEEGLIRVRTPHMVSGYHNDAQATAEAFRDGWFYPGDRGALRGDGLLVLAGRESELINRGGVKIDPAAIDHVLVDWPGIEDAAVFGYENTAGVQEVGAALVVADDFDIAALREGLLKKLGPSRCPSRFFRVDKILRNRAGKPMRAQLSKQITQWAATRTPDAG